MGWMGKGDDLVSHFMDPANAAHLEGAVGPEGMWEVRAKVNNRTFVLSE